MCSIPGTCDADASERECARALPTDFTQPRMFKYFPTNYVWNLSVDLAIEMGARIGEIEEMCAPLQDAATAPDAAGTRAFRETWVGMADKLCALADEDKARGRLLSAGEKLNRGGHLPADRRAPAGARQPKGGWASIAACSRSSPRA